MRVAVAGAGAFGVAATLHLAAAGADVVLIEREQVAAATTGLAAGLISLGVMDDLDRRLVAASLAGFAGLDPGGAGRLLHRPGSHILARTPPEAAHLEAVARDLARLELPAEQVAPEAWMRAMRARGIAVEADDLVSVLSLPADAWALSTEATQAMMRAAREAGARFKRDEATALIRDTRGRVTGLRLASGEDIVADRVVVALGAWTRPFLAASNLRVPTQCYTTHAAVLQVPRADRFPILHDHPGHYYLRPEGPNHLLVGNGTDTTRADVESFAPVAVPGFAADIAARITARFPGLASARLQNAWRGILTGTPDQAALVGAHPDAPGLFLAAGDNGFGFMRSYALGAVLAHLMMGAALPEPVPDDAAARLDPARFWPDPPAAFVVREGFALPATG